MRKLRLVLFGTLFAAIAVALACGGGKETAAPAPAAKPAAPAAAPAAPAAAPVPALIQPAAQAPAAAAKPKYGGIMVSRENNESTTWDPHKTHTEKAPVALAFDRLFRPIYAGKECGLFPSEAQLAESWRWVEGGNTLEVTIRKGVRFQDAPPVSGRELVADDVVASFKSLFKRLPFARAVAGFVTDVVKVDQYTVRFVLKQPFGEFIDAISFHSAAVMPLEAAGPDGEFQFGELKHTGTGPFMFEDLRPGSVIKMVKNPNYWQKSLPYLDGMDILYIADEVVALAAMRGGRLDGTEISQSELVKQIKDSPGTLVTTICGWDSAQSLWMNVQKAPFNDVRVRRAVAMSIDRDGFNRSLYQGLGIPRYSPVHSWFPDLRLGLTDYPAETQKSLRYDPQGAKQLLAQAGYPNGITAPLVTWAGFRNFVPMAEALAAMLETGGIKTQLNVMTREQYADVFFLRPKPEYDGMAIAYNSSNTVYETLYSYFHSSSGRNRSLINDPVLDKLLEGVVGESDAAKGKQLIREVQLYLADKQYRIELPQSPYMGVWQSYVKNVTYKMTGYSPVEFYQWTWLDK
jgi:peptide/nickel transport system substrate-binding protein